MNKFSWYKALGFGLAIWVIAFAVVALTFGVGIFHYVATQIVIAAIMGIVAYAFASLTNNDEPGHALGYGAVFAAVGIVLDLIVSRLLVGGLFGLWTYYLAYAAVLFAPTVQAALGSTKPSARAV